MVFFVHLAATLDNWDPRIVDPIAKNRHVITFDQRGVGASTGKVPATLEEAADHAYEFITALGFEPEELPTLFNTPELIPTANGTIAVDAQFQTSLPGVFAAGDIVRGASLVVWAIKEGRDAAAAIHRHVLARKVEAA